MGIRRTVHRLYATDGFDICGTDDFGIRSADDFNRRGSHDVYLRCAGGRAGLADERIDDCDSFVLADERVNDCNTFVWRLLGGVSDGWPVQVSCDTANADCDADYGGADSNGDKADWHSCAAAGPDR